ncbi:MAG: hypothetical protein K1W31_05175 [Lachnospiraceae bacterium]
MDTAQNLLKYSDLSCSEIAASLGYCSRSAFTYAFRQFTGTPPESTGVNLHIQKSGVCRPLSASIRYHINPHTRSGYCSAISRNPRTSP